MGPAVRFQRLQQDCGCGELQGNLEAGLSEALLPVPMSVLDAENALDCSEDVAGQDKEGLVSNSGLVCIANS